MNKKILIIIIIVIVIIGAAFYFLQQPKYKQNNGSNLPKNTDNSSSQPSTNKENVPSSTYSIVIENFSFKPAEIKIKKGDTITWTNQDSVSHKILGNPFQSDPLAKGQSFSFTFNSAGTFDYICGIHPAMKGSIIVQ